MTVMTPPLNIDVARWTPYELWTWGQKQLGYGDWDETKDVPYQKWAGLEAHKLAKVMTKRNVSNWQFAVAVLWCKRHHKRIENAVWVLKHVADAWAEHQSLVRTDVAQLIEQAIQVESARNRADTADWVARLTRARGPYRLEVLAEWRASEL